jgi:hypothetical protein
MSAVTFKFKALPKRLLKKSEAANYCGLPRTRFEATCPVQPILMPTGDEFYDVRDLDAWIDSIKAGAPDNNAEAIVGRLGK